jgi:hypothetical protein
MSLREGPPLPRERASARELEHRTIVGAQPWTLDYGQAAGLTRAYAARVNTLVDEMQNAVSAWARELVDAHQKLTDDQIKFLFQSWPLFHAAWESHYVALNDFAPFTGMTSEEAWQKTETFEERLHALRETFGQLTTVYTTKAPPDPGSLETPGGQPTPGIGDAIGAGLGGVVGAIPWGTIALAVGLGVGAVFLAPKLLGSS